VHRRRPLAVSRGPRRKLIWATQNPSSVAVAAATAAAPVSLLNNLVAGGVGITGGTVVRIRCLLSFSSADTDTDAGFFVGIMMFDGTVVAAGKPAPNSDFASDWMYNALWTPGSAPNAIGTPINAPTSVLYGGSVDIKAKRRIHEMNDLLYLQIFNGGTVAGSYTAFVRTLVQLP